ncbi:hypothetical protein [Pseudoxanthomonas putridarboris]|uniref:Uncharacterized protein n=1 Tax=Pseudoxanthomonas putridarboris TaxID=752605 RepID=A0ABU9IV42_9GAMM
MDDTLFDELLRSMEQMDGIVRGQHSPSRAFDLELPGQEPAEDILHD